MKKLLTLCLALTLVFSFAAIAGAESISIGTDPKIVVMGNGTVSVAPDIANIYLGVSETNELIGDAQTATNQKINAIIAALGEKGVDAKDIQTQNYSIYPQYDYSDGGEKFRGYTASCQLKVIVRKVDDAGAVIDAAFAVGANRLDNFEYAIADSSAAKDEALTLAVQDAQHKAEVIAQASGQQLVAIYTIKEDMVETYDYQPIYARTMAEEADGSTQLQAGMLNVSMRVTIEYIISAN